MKSYVITMKNYVISIKSYITLKCFTLNLGAFLGRNKKTRSVYSDLQWYSWCVWCKELRVKFSRYLSHELFSCEYELVVYHPSWLLLEQAAVWMNHDCLQAKKTNKKHVSTIGHFRIHYCLFFKMRSCAVSTGKEFGLHVNKSKRKSQFKVKKRTKFTVFMTIILD